MVFVAAFIYSLSNYVECLLPMCVFMTVTWQAKANEFCIQRVHSGSYDMVKQELVSCVTSI